MNNGQVSDIYTVVILLVVFMFGIITSFIVLQDIDAEFAQLEASTETSEEIIDKSGQAWNLFDIGMLLLVSGMYIALFVSSFYIKAHPAFFVTFLLGLILFAFISPLFTNMLVKFQTSDAVDVDVESKFPFMYFFSRHIPHMVALAGGVFLIGLYAKRLGVGGRESRVR